MGGYIGARAGTISATVANVPKVNAQDITATDTTPEVTIINNTHEDSDLGREGKVIFKGQQSGGEESTLAEIEANHSGSSDDEKGQLIIRTNDGSDGASPTEAMRIDSSQNVGIGTAAPVRNFHLHEAASSTPVVFAMSTNGTGATTGDGFNISIDGSSGAVNFIQRENESMQFYTNGGSNERMRIASGGELFVGGFSSSLGGGNHKLQIYTDNSSGDSGILIKHRDATGASSVTAQYFLNNSGATAGTITMNSSSVSYNTSSDYRLKENVTDVTDGITRVKQLAPKRFNFIADADTTVDGFLAHEAATVVPEAVHGTKDEVDDDDNAVMQGIDQSKLVPLLTAALQEAITKIETLETKVAALEAE